MRGQPEIVSSLLKQNIARLRGTRRNGQGGGTGCDANGIQCRSHSYQVTGSELGLGADKPRLHGGGQRYRGVDDRVLLLCEKGSAAVKPKPRGAKGNARIAGRPEWKSIRTLGVRNRKTVHN